MITSAPHRSSTFAVFRPIPFPAPVMKALLPLKSENYATKFLVNASYKIYRPLTIKIFKGIGKSVVYCLKNLNIARNRRVAAHTVLIFLSC